MAEKTVAKDAKKGDFNEQMEFRKGSNKMASSNFVIQKGFPSPLGCSQKEKGVNFALFSKNATQVFLLLFAAGDEKLLAEIELDPKVNKTGSIWHILIQGLPNQIEYVYRLNGPHQPKKGHLFNVNHTVLDPYAHSLNTSSMWEDEKSWKLPKARAILPSPFSWDGVTHPKHALADLIIYEMHVRGFTRHPSSKVIHPGTFLGIIDKIPHLKTLGVNAIELLPIHEFNETENKHHNPKTQKKLCNYWGYSSVNFFSPMNRYASSDGWNASILEFKELVKQLHKNQIEIILDVVFNHTAEDGAHGLCYSFRGIDNAIYYQLQADGQYVNATGCFNTVNCNHPVVQELILQSLRYWVSEMHVDGFRFDLASIFMRDEHGHPVAHPPILRAISEDPILADTKLIAEPWDAAGLYHVGQFPKKWAEWNGKYRDDVRRFIKGGEGLSGAFATRLFGSQDLYGSERKPYHSINFVTAHDGFTLRDLVSYQKKHNEENGENNRDGMNENDSSNYGVEGETENPEIIKLRKKQMRNFHLALMLSLGTPMICMGDEYGHTRLGNNNAYCLDNEKNWFLWGALEKEHEFFQFFSRAIAFRKNHPLLRSKEFLNNEDVLWHGVVPLKPDWSTHNRLVIYQLKEPSQRQDLLIAFNSSNNPLAITLADPPEKKCWKLLIDTSLPDGFVANPEKGAPLGIHYKMPGHSAFVLQAYPCPRGQKTIR